MKFFHISDLHIGARLYDFDLAEDQKYILEQIRKQAENEKPDAVVIAGDVYDRAIPSAEAVDLFNCFITELSEAVDSNPIMIISGNHDNPSRIDCYRELLRKQNIYLVGKIPLEQNEYIEKVLIEDEYGKVNFYLLPFVKPTEASRLIGKDENGRNFSYDECVRRILAREDIDSTVRNVIVSHQLYLGRIEVERADSEILTIGNIDRIGTDALEVFDYAALGHIHKPINVDGDTVRYSGTPLAYSVSEAGQDKGITVVNMKEKGNVSVSVIPLKPLRQVKCIEGTLDEVRKEGCNDYVSVRLTEMPKDVYNVRELLKEVFPSLLEVRMCRNTDVTDRKRARNEKDITPYELCCDFLPDMTEEEKDIIADVINSVKEGK